MMVLPDAEDRTIVSSSLTDGWTDGQSDRQPVAITAVCIAGNVDTL